MKTSDRAEVSVQAGDYILVRYLMVTGFGVYDKCEEAQEATKRVSQIVSI